MIDLDGSASWDFLSYVLKTKSELKAAEIQEDVTDFKDMREEQK